MLRRGRIIGRRETRETRPDEIVSMITGAGRFVGAADDRVQQVVRTASSISRSVTACSSCFWCSWPSCSYEIDVRDLPEHHQCTPTELGDRHIACGMTFAIILGGFDLSVGAVAHFQCRWRDADDRRRRAWHPVWDRRRTTRLSCRRSDERLADRLLGVDPFVATLGTMSVVRGLIYVATDATPRFGVPYSFTAAGLGHILSIPIPAIIFATVALLLGFVLHRLASGTTSTP